METPLYFKNGPFVIVMGVCGSGKTTIAKAIASKLELPFLEGDDYHPPSNVEKMSNAIELNDADRWPWLDLLGMALKKKNNSVKSGVIASCSALKRSYRERLTGSSDALILFVFLGGSRQTLLNRMLSRKDHYMPSSLLDSQLDTLEKPENDELALTVSIEKSIDEIVEEVLLKITSMTLPS